MNTNIAVIPVAGLGTRWLPITRSVPKSLIPVWKHTAVFYSVQEAVQAGIEEIVFVIAPRQTQVIEHFVEDQHLLRELGNRRLDPAFEELQMLWQKVEVHTAIQEEPLGLGHAVYCAKDQVGSRSFALILPDDILISDQNPLYALAHLCEEDRDSAVLLMKVDPRESIHYGMAQLGKSLGLGWKLTDLVEKPDVEHAPSDYAVAGRYLLQPEIFDCLEDQKVGKNGEIQLTDALAQLAHQGRLRAAEFHGIRHDVGRPEGLLLASVDLALRDPLWKDVLKNALVKLLEC